MTEVEIFNLIIAVLALILSGISLYLSQREKGTRLSINTNFEEAELYGYFCSSNHPNIYLSIHRKAPFIKANIRNICERDVNISTITVRIVSGFLFFTKKYDFSELTLFPYADDSPNTIQLIESRHSKKVYIHGQELYNKLPVCIQQARSKISVAILLEDLIGNKYKSNTFRLTSTKLIDKNVNADVESKFRK